MISQLDLATVLEELSAQGYDDEKLEALGSHISLADDIVSVEQLAAAGIANRVVFGLRRHDEARREAERQRIANAERELREEAEAIAREVSDFCGNLPPWMIQAGQPDFFLDYWMPLPGG